MKHLATFTLLLSFLVATCQKPAAVLVTGSGTNVAYPVSGASTDAVAKYFFTEPSGTTTLTDFSGKGNTGSYVGNPTRIPGGGFQANGATAYAKAAANVLSRTQTIYIAVDVAPDNVNLFQIIMGSSLTSGARFKIGQVVFSNGQQFHGANITTENGDGKGAESVISAAASPYILTIVMDTLKVDSVRIYLDGVPVKYYFSQSKDIVDRRGGIPYFGYSQEGGANYISPGTGFYYAAFHGGKHTAVQVAQEVAYIRNLMVTRGNTFPAPFPGTSGRRSLVGLGNSIMQQYYTFPKSLNLLGDSLGNCDVYNRGWGGIRSYQLEQSNDALTKLYYKPGQKNFMVFEAGTNDYGNGITAESAAWQQLNQCELATQRGWITCIQTMVDRDDAGNYPAQRAWLDSVTTIIRQHWRGRASSIADVAAIPELGAINASHNPTYFPYDQTHPGPAGVKLIASSYYQALKPYN